MVLPCTAALLLVSRLAHRWHRWHCCLRDRQRGSAPLARAAATPAGPTSGLHGEELQLLLPLQRGWGGLLPQWHKGPGLLRPVPGHPLWAGGRHRRSRRRCSSQSIAWSCASTSSSRRTSRCKIRCALGRRTTRSSAAAPAKATSISTRTSPGGGSHGLGIRTVAPPISVHLWCLRKPASPAAGAARTRAPSLTQGRCPSADQVGANTTQQCLRVATRRDPVPLSGVGKHKQSISCLRPHGWVSRVASLLVFTASVDQP